MTRRIVLDIIVPIVVILAPVVCAGLRIGTEVLPTDQGH